MAVAWVVKVLETAANGSSLSEAFSRFLKYSPLTIPVLIFAAVYILATLVSVLPRLASGDHTKGCKVRSLTLHISPYSS